MNQQTPSFSDAPVYHVANNLASSKANNADTNAALLELRDIHLPEPITWWPLAPGWWISLAAILISIAIIFISIKIYKSRQLKRDIQAELNTIKQTFQETQNKSQLAKSLSVLLRRASISYYTKNETAKDEAARTETARDETDGENTVAGLTGENWLNWLDSTNKKSQNTIKFKSDVGNILIKAPYLPDSAPLEFDAEALIRLSESWLLAKHKNKQGAAS